MLARRMSSESPDGSVPSVLFGWGANHRVPCCLKEPDSETATHRQLDARGCIARGLGRSYGDPAVNKDGRVLGLTRLDRYLGFDPDSAVLECEAGVSLAQIIADFAPRGFFPSITPGTKFVTVGGCIANDVHGKAHHAQGCFSACVDSMRILLADGRVLQASRDENADLFWGSFGGMGLLGVVLTARIRLRRVETTYFRKRCIVAKSLEEMLAALEEYDEQFPYSVATVDPFASGKRLGSGVLQVGDHAALSDLPAALAKEPLKLGRGPVLTVPFEMPQITLNPLTVRRLTRLILFKQAHDGEVGHYEGFFYPLDILDLWYRGYGRRGFTQYQFVIPFEDGPKRLRALLGEINSAGELPFLNVLKRFGKESGGVLSFPCEGYTFAIDFPIRRNTAALLKRLDAMVLDAGGRVYLGKDSFLDAETFRAMYPEAIDRFLQLKQQYDPQGVFTSDLARRVGLAPADQALQSSEIAAVSRESSSGEMMYGGIR